MLKLCRIRIAVDFHCSDGRGRHVELSAIQAVDNNRSSFTPVCCGIRERVNEWQEVIDCEGKPAEKSLVDFHRFRVGFRGQPIIGCVGANGNFLFDSSKFQFDLQETQLFRPHLNVRLVRLEPVRVNLKEVSSWCQIRETEFAIFCRHRLQFCVGFLIDQSHFDFGQLSAARILNFSSHASVLPPHKKDREHHKCEKQAECETQGGGENCAAIP